MKIGELAQRGGVSTKTVRYYESIGLLIEPARTVSGYRDYDEAAAQRLSFIRDAQRSGLTLAEIQSVLDLKDAGSRSCAHTRSLLEQHLDDLDDQIQRLRATRQSLTALAERAKDLEPAACSDPNRCQVIESSREPNTSLSRS